MYYCISEMNNARLRKKSKWKLLISASEFIFLRLFLSGVGTPRATIRIYRCRWARACEWALCTYLSRKCKFASIVIEETIGVGLLLRSSRCRVCQPWLSRILWSLFFAVTTSRLSFRGSRATVIFNVVHDLYCAGRAVLSVVLEPRSLARYIPR